MTPNAQKIERPFSAIAGLVCDILSGLEVFGVLIDAKENPDTPETAARWNLAKIKEDAEKILDLVDLPAIEELA
jgi:hypothetical protein